MIANLAALIKRVDELLPAVQLTLDRVDRSVESLDERAALLDHRGRAGRPPRRSRPAP
jgi:hypothetical protein